MSDQLPMFGQTTSGDIPSAISSLELESGHTRSGSLDGRTNAKSGPEVAPANPSARPAKAKRSTTKGIFGQSGFHSSKHEDLSFALASRLRPLTDSLGSTLFNLTWMTRITPAGRSICALRASEPLTEGSVYIGWPTPQSSDMTGGGQAKRSDGWGNLNDFAMLAGWPTATNTDGSRGGEMTEGMSGTSLVQVAKMAGWPTTRATDAEKNCRTQEGAAREMERKGSPQDLLQAALLTAWGTPAARDWKSGDASQKTLGRNARPLNEQAQLAGWGTPKASDGEGGRTSTTEGGGNVHLDKQARLSGWGTPRVTTNGGYPSPQCTGKGARLEDQAGLAQFVPWRWLERWPVDPSMDSGPTPIGFLLGRNGWEIVPASGQLNAGHSRWLMGLPRAWDDCGVTAMVSLRKSRRHSSKRT